MEPLSAVASVIALAQAAEKLVSAGKFAKSIGQIPKEYAELLDDLRINQTLAQQIDQRIHQYDVADGEMLGDLSMHLNGSVQRLEDLVAVVKRASRASEGDKASKVSTLRWQMNKSELANIKASMKQTKDNLQLCLQMLSSTHVALVLQSTLHMERNISTLQEALTRFSTKHLIETHEETHARCSEAESPQEASAAILQTETHIEKTSVTIHSQPQAYNPLEDTWELDHLDHCDPYCSCCCHDLPTKRPLGWIEFIVGSLVVNTNTSPLYGRRACNNSACKVPSQSLIRVRYTYPQWYARRVVDATMSWGALSGTGASLHLRVPRVVDPDLLTPIEFGEPEKFRQLLVTRALLPADVDMQGFPLMVVAFHFGGVAREERLEIYKMLMEFGFDLALSGPTGSGVLMARRELRLFGLEYKELCPAWIPALRKAAYGNPQACVQPVRLNGVLRAFFEGDDKVFEAVVRNVDREKLDFIDECGLGAIHYAIWHKRTDALRLLLEAGANPELQGNGERPVDIAIWTEIPSEMLDLLLQNGANPNGRTLFDVSSICLTLGQPEKMRILLDYGARPIVTDSELETPYHTQELMTVCRSEAAMEECIQMLHEHGVDINHQDSIKGTTPLMQALIRCDIMAMKCLIRRGARLDLTASDGKTILHIAAMAPWVEMIDYLRTIDLSHFEPDKVDRRGREAEDMEPHHSFKRRQIYTRGEFATFCDEIREAKYGSPRAEEVSAQESSDDASESSDEEDFMTDTDMSGSSPRMPGDWPEA